MDHRSVGRPAGTSNIVPGMPGDHPASIPGPRGSPGAPQRHRCPVFAPDTFFTARTASGSTSWISVSCDSPERDLSIARIFRG